MIMYPKQIGFILNGSVLVYQNDHQVQFWKLQDRQLLHHHEGYFIGTARNGQSFLLESLDHVILAYDTRTGYPISIGTV